MYSEYKAMQLFSFLFGAINILSNLLFLTEEIEIRIARIAPKESTLNFNKLPLEYIASNQISVEPHVTIWGGVNV